MILYRHVWHVWWWFITNENNTSTSFSNTKSCTFSDCRFHWRINVFTWSTSKQELTTIIATTWKNFSFICFKKWMITTSISCPYFVSPKRCNFSEWRNCICFFIDTKLTIIIWTTSKNMTFFTNSKEMIVCTWNINNFFICKFFNKWKIEKTFFVFNFGRENSTIWTWNNDWSITTSNNWASLWLLFAEWIK